MQAMIQAESMVKETVGELVATLIRRFIKVKNKVISNAILPGIISCGMTKLIWKMRIHIIIIFFSKKIISFLTF